MEYKKIRIRVIQGGEEAERAEEFAAPREESPAESSGESEARTTLFPFRDAGLSTGEKIGKTALYAAFFLAPLFFLPITVFPVETNKIVVLALLMLIGGGACLGEAVARRAVPYPRSFVALAFAGFLASLLISTIFSVQRSVSVYGNLFISDSLLVFGTAAMGLFLSYAFLGPRDRKPILTLLLTSISLLAIIGILELFGAFFIAFDAARSAAMTPAGPFSAWGTMMVFGMVLAALLWRSARGRKEKLLLLVALLLTGAGLFFLNEHFNWLVLGIVTLAVAGMRYAENESLRVPVAALLLIFLVFFAGSYIPSFTKASIEVRPNAQSTFSIAKQFVQGSRAFFGGGPSTFGLAYSRFRTAQSNQSDFWNVRFFDGYSALLALLATGGIVGVLLFLAFMLAIVLFLLQRVSNGDIPLASAIFAGVLSWLFYPFSAAGSLLVSMGTGFLLSLSIPRSELSFPTGSRTRSFLFFTGAMCVAVLLVWVFYGVGRHYLAAIYYGEGIRDIGRGSTQSAVIEIARAASFDPASDEYARSLSQVYLVRAREFFSQGGLASSAGADAVSAAVQEAHRATELNPQDSLNWANAAVVYENIVSLAAGADGFAVQSYMKAHDLAPQNPDYLIGEARVFLVAASRSTNDPTTQQGLLARAGELLRSAVDVKPDYLTSRILLGQLYLQTGDLAHATEQFQEAAASHPADAGIAFQVGILYYQSGKFNEARQAFERAVALNANYSNARYFLGLIYDRAGLHAEATDQFKKILALNPGNDMVKQIIANLDAGKNALEGILVSGTPPASPQPPAPPKQQPAKKKT